MLDGDVLPLHNDPLDEQADEPLAPGEVERRQAVADGCGEGLKVQPWQFLAHVLDGTLALGCRFILAVGIAAAPA